MPEGGAYDFKDRYFGDDLYARGIGQREGGDRPDSITYGLDGTEEGSRTLITPRPDHRTQRVRTAVGYSGPSSEFTLTPTSQYLHVRNSKVLQFESNCDILVYRGERPVYEIPACRFVEILNTEGDTYALRALTDRPAERKVQMLTPGPYVGPLTVTGDWKIPPDVSALLPSFGLMCVLPGSTVGTPTVTTQTRPISDPAAIFNIDGPDTIVDGCTRKLPGIPSGGLATAIRIQIDLLPGESFTLESYDWIWGPPRQCEAAASTRLQDADAKIRLYTSGPKPTVETTL